MKAAWVAKWSRPIPGREAKALEAFMESMDFWDKRQADGQIERRDTYLSPAGPGMVIMTGEHAELSSILGSEDYLRIVAKVELNVDGLDGELLFTGEGSDRLIGIWAETAGAQGYM
jgi:hypothetical protein